MPHDWSEYLDMLIKYPLIYRNIYPKFLSERDKLSLLSLWYQKDDFISSFFRTYKNIRKDSKITLFDFLVKFYISMYLIEMAGKQSSIAEATEIIKNKLEDTFGISFESQTDTIISIITSYLSKPENMDLNDWYVAQL